jgi:hypothetical protein
MDKSKHSEKSHNHELGLGLMLESDVGVRVLTIVFKELRDGAGALASNFPRSGGKQTTILH